MSPPEPDFGSRTDFYTFAPESLADALPEFEIVREVGKGSMGIVYEARWTDGKRVALKVLPPSLTLTERALARFLREGEIMSRIEHPNIVRVYDLGGRDRLHYFVMEFVDGVNLEERIEVGPLPIRQAAELGAQIGRALHFAHERGVVHRDIKPGNLILRDDGSIAITDFGLARETGTGSMTESGAIVGTPMFMAPEQIIGDRSSLDARADVYGLGSTLYTLLTTHPPFAGPTAQSVLTQVLDEDPVPPTRLRAELPRDLEAIVTTAMAKEPSHRYGSALELAEDLDRFSRGEAVIARLPSRLTRVYRKAIKRPLLTTLALVSCLLAVGAFYFYRDSLRRQLQVQLAGAERSLAMASSLFDDQLRERSADDRRELLVRARDEAAAVTGADDGYAQAWFVLAKANHGLGEYENALVGLTIAEELLGEPTAEILHYRIDALSHIAKETEQLLAALEALLRTDENTYNRCLVARHMLDIARRSPDRQSALLRRVDEILDAAATTDARTRLARARYHELAGDSSHAVTMIRDAIAHAPDEPIVLAEAATLLTRLGFDSEGERAKQLGRALTEDNLADVSAFLRELGELIDDLRR